VKIKCPCCEGTGEIEDTIPLFLTPLQIEIYKATRDTKGGIGIDALINKLYGDRHDGGPDFAQDVVHVTIFNMNKRLAAIKEQVKANRRGAGAVYRLHKNVV
jgi:hypothetical protein